MTIYNLVSFIGIFLFLGIAWLVSSQRNRMNWRVIFWGVALQLLFGIFVFQVISRVPQQFNPFLIINSAVVAVIECASAGATFVFGPLADTNDSTFLLAFEGLPTIIFFSSLMSILYFFGIMQRIIAFFSRLFTRLMNISGAESLCASGNIFVGIESVLSIRPFLKSMTRSELCTILTAGMATVASNVLALYVGFLKAEFPLIAAHLVSASILSAPAAVVMSKILVPETGRPVTLGMRVNPSYSRESNVFEAVIKGAQAGARLIVGIVSLLIAVLGLVALANLGLDVVSGWFGADQPWTLSGILGYVMYPFAVIMGVAPGDAHEIGSVIGMRVFETEIPGYLRLASAIADGTIRDTRSYIIGTYALCGFAHVASMAIFVGGVSAIAPERTSDLSRIGLRALIAATLACFMTACVAGTFFTGNAMLLGTG